MNTATPSARFQVPDADRVGVFASVLCAIHCGIAPILLIALPTFGKIWAHPASHALVAIFIIPLAISSIRRGYKRHRRHWVALVAGIGILCILVGAVLPALTEKKPILATTSTNQTDSYQAAHPVPKETSDEACTADCETTCSEEECATTNETISIEGEAPSEVIGCVDNCCPSAQISETGEISLHIPSAAIVTTLGGLFLITAHVGNLMVCRKCCPTPNAA